MLGLWLQLGGSSILASVGRVAAIMGSLLLVLMLVALGVFAYRSLRGGITWPEDTPEEEGALREGDDDDEWEYY